MSITGGLLTFDRQISIILTSNHVGFGNSLTPQFHPRHVLPMPSSCLYEICVDKAFSGRVLWFVTYLLAMCFYQVLMYRLVSCYLVRMNNGIHPRQNGKMPNEQLYLE